MAYGKYDGCCRQKEEPPQTPMSREKSEPMLGNSACSSHVESILVVRSILAHEQIANSDSKCDVSLANTMARWGRGLDTLSRCAVMEGMDMVAISGLMMNPVFELVGEARGISWSEQGRGSTWQALRV